MHSRTLEEHLQRLDALFRRLKEVNLKLKPSKCTLLQKKVLFLGHVVSGEGITTDPEKIRLIEDWPVPVNLKQLRSFLGLCGYYRKFVKDYSYIAGPLNKLLRKDQPFQWTEECQRSFQGLKEALMSPPVLGLPNDVDPFILDTDAAEDSIGGVLSQLQNGEERVIAYSARALNKAEVSYCITRKELLAVVHFVKHFRQYLLGRTFTIRTDHAALSWLKKTPEPIGQNARWLEQLGEYDYVITHRKGTSHSNADALSRHPCLHKPSCTACHPAKELNLVDTEDTTKVLTADRQTHDATDRVICAKARVVDELCFSESTDESMSDEESIFDDGGEYCMEPVSVCGSVRQFRCRQTDCQPTEASPGDENQPTDLLGWTASDILTAQHEDVEIHFIIDLLSGHTERPSWDVVSDQSPAVKSLFNEWERLVIEDGVLFRKWTSIGSAANRKQVVLPQKYRREFIRLAHSGATGGHLGKTKTQEQVALRAYWPAWKEDVSLELKCCAECAQYHRGKAPHQTPLRPFNASEPFEIISVDITGKHPRSSRGNEYIITTIDLFSKWGDATAVRSHTAPVVAKVLFDNIFSRFGMPKKILTDQGSEFEACLFKELCLHMGIQKIRTTPYQPSTNGCVERFHRTLNSMIGKIVQHDQKNWDECLPIVMAAYRAAKHESTGFSPNRLVFGRENRAPLDLVLGIDPDDEEHHCSYEEFVYQKQQQMRDCYQIAREHLKAAARRRKDDYDASVKSKTFEVGQWVYYFYPRRFSRRTPKWCKTYTGPFLVVRVLPPNDYVIQKSSKATPFVVHSDKLKLCYGETPRSWLDTAQPSQQPEMQQQDRETAGAQPNEDPVPQHQQRESQNVQLPRQQRRRTRTYSEEDGEFQRALPPRRHKMPARFEGFEM